MPNRPWYCPSGIQDIEFSTGFVYQMNLATESIYTVHSVGGFEDSFLTVYRQKWNICDKADVLQMLDQYALPDFEQFDRSVKGTKDLYDFLTGGDEHQAPDFMRFVFGCIVYHQMLYHDDETLSGWYMEDEEDGQQS